MLILYIKCFCIYMQDVGLYFSFSFLVRFGSQDYALIIEKISSLFQKKNFFEICVVSFLNVEQNPRAQSSHMEFLLLKCFVYYFNFFHMYGSV